MLQLDFNLISKLISVGILLTSVIVGLTTIHHGDLSLGLLVLLGQLQTHVSHGKHGEHDAAHVLIHNSVEGKKHV